MNFGTKILLMMVFVSCFYSCSDDMGAGNQEPTVTFRKTFTLHNTEYTGRLDVKDADGDSVVITIRKKPAWATYNSQEREFTGFPSWGDIGKHDLSVSASDGKVNLTFDFEIEVQVTPANCGADYGDPAESLYRSPIAVGKTTRVINGTCRPSDWPFGHIGYHVYDLTTNDRDTVYAARAGIATLVRENQLDNNPNFQMGQENLLYIKHVDNTIGRYVHFARDGVIVTPGQFVQQGDPVGLIGKSTPTSTPLLHFDVFINDLWDDYPFDIGKNFSQPVNFSNMDGPLTENRALIHGETYLVVE